MKATASQRAYRRYLKSDHWLKLRSEAIARDGWKCVLCPNVDRLQVHHKVYRDRWDEGVLDDVETLCFKCHGEEHGFKVWEAREFDLAIDGIKRRMNRITPENKYESFVTDEEFAELLGMVEDDLDVREVDNLIRQKATVRIILSSSKMWESWLSKDQIVKSRLWSWSEMKRQRLVIGKDHRVRKALCQHV